MTSEEKYLYDRALSLVDELAADPLLPGRYLRTDHALRMLALYDGVGMNSYMRGEWKPSAGPRSLTKWYGFGRKDAR